MKAGREMYAFKIILDVEVRRGDVMEKNFSRRDLWEEKSAFNLLDGRSDTGRFAIHHGNVNSVNSA